MVLHNNLDVVLKLLDYIEFVNSESNNQIDFLTLREDFSAEADYLRMNAKNYWVSLRRLMKD